MKKLTAGILTVMLGLVVADANAAITSQKYVDDRIEEVSTIVSTKAAQSEVNTLTTTVGNTALATKAQTVTGAINELNTSIDTLGDSMLGETDVTTLIDNSVTDEDSAVYKALNLKADKTQVAIDIAGAVKEEADRAKLAEGTNATDIASLQTDKQDTLTSTGDNANIVFDGEGNVVTAVSAANGVVTIARGNALTNGDIDTTLTADSVNTKAAGAKAVYDAVSVKQDASQIGEVTSANMGASAGNTTVVAALNEANTVAKAAKEAADAAMPGLDAGEIGEGQYVLTMTNDAGKMSYKWEKISRDDKTEQE